MYMSTSLRKGRVKPISIVAGVILVFSASSAPAASFVSFGYQPTADEVSSARNVLRAEFTHLDDMPDRQPIIDKRESYFWWDSKNRDKRMLVVTKINFRNVLNAYCRLIIISNNIKKAVIVPLPAQVNYDDCGSVSKPIYADLNQDNIEDVVYEVEVKSNRYSQNAMVPMVYLSEPKSASGYCYATELSDKVEPQDLIDAKTLQARVKGEVERLGRGILQCGRQ